MSDEKSFDLQCPLPAVSGSVRLGHGSGGQLTKQLIDQFFQPFVGNDWLDQAHDATIVTAGSQRLAMTTDAFVVRPLIFPGGDIGSLAVHGTVNDLAMAGARPMWMSAAFILEEGFPLETLGRLTASLGKAAQTCGIVMVAGDTKVVDKGKGDGLFITTTGVGLLEHPQPIQPASVRVGDAILLSGDIGRHGVAIMAEREGLQFESQIQSDSAPLWAPVRSLLAAKVPVHCLRDLTRGGLATSVVEIAESAHVALEIDEAAIPVRDDVRGACEMLGLDPLYIANEGRFISFVPGAEADRTVALLRGHTVSSGACRIGTVTGPGGTATLRSAIGAHRALDRLSGDQLPRIC